MYNEDRDHILLGIFGLIEIKLKEKGLSEEEIEELWTDEIWDKIDDLFEPYSQGWRNYN